MRKLSKKVKSKLPKILLGPLDSGLNYDLKMALTKLGFQVTTLNFVQNQYVFPSDIVLDIRRVNFYRASLLVLVNLLKSFSYDIYHFRFGQSLLPWNLDLPLLRMLGKKIVMNFDGTDIRISHRFHKTKYNTIFSQNSPETLVQRIKKQVRYRWIKIWANYLTVTTPDLLEFAPGAELIFNPVPLSIKNKQKLISVSKKIKIIHAPTNRPIKGTKYIIKAVQRLKKHYPIELIIVENKPHAEIDVFYHGADIVIDQLLMGALSTVSLEGMMYGKPVICYLRDDLRKYYPRDLPVISANSDNIYQVLEEMIKNKGKLPLIGRKSLNYIKQYYYPNVIARKWKKIYLGL